MLPPAPPFRSLGVLVLPWFLGLAACSQAEGDVREWRPTDHKHQTESAASNAQAPQVSGSAEAPLPGLEEVTIAAWRRNCTTCHGQLGRGDGPQGAMVRARDLSDPAWQASVTDARIAESIVRGKGTMPAFPLPPETVTGLVRLVRLFDREQPRTQPRAAPPATAGAPHPASSAGGAGAVPAPPAGTRPEGSTTPAAPAGPTATSRAPLSPAPGGGASGEAAGTPRTSSTTGAPP